LHAEGVVHGDLRGPNLLVDQNESIRLADFGLARLVETLGHTMTSGSPTNTQWTAPEVLNPEYFGSKSTRVTERSDVYSFACVCIELYTCDPPFHCHYGISSYTLPTKVVDSNLRPDRPMFCAANEAMPDELWTLINRSWAPFAAERPAAAQLVSSMSQITSTDSSEGF